MNQTQYFYTFKFERTKALELSDDDEKTNT